jgi:hypothetical protein
MATDLLDPGIGDVPPNNAFERPVKRRFSVRGRRVVHCAPSARLIARRSTAQREG